MDDLITFAETNSSLGTLTYTGQWKREGGLIQGTYSSAGAKRGHFTITL